MSFPPTDVSVYNMTFSDAPDVAFDEDVDNIITFEVVLKNAGGTDIASIAADSDSSNDEDNNWVFSFVVSDLDDPTDSSASVITTDAETTSSTNMAAGISAGSTLTLENVLGLVNVPSADCQTYQYLCVVMSKSSTAVYTDSDSTNNYYCVAGFGNADADYLQCSGKRPNKFMFKVDLNVKCCEKCYYARKRQ